MLVDTGSSNFGMAGVASEELGSYFKSENSSSFVDLGKKIRVIYAQVSYAVESLSENFVSGTNS